jgi:hypothetical protein
LVRNLSGTRERVARHRQRAAEAGMRQVNLFLPAGLIAALDARGTDRGMTRAGAFTEAVTDWLARTAPAPAPAPAPALPARTRTRTATRAAPDAAGRVPVFLRFPMELDAIRGNPVEDDFRAAGLRRHAPHGWIGRLVPAMVEQIAERAAMWGGWLHVTGGPGEAPVNPRRITEATVRSLPPSVRSDLCDALQRYRSRFHDMPGCISASLWWLSGRPPQVAPRMAALLNTLVEQGERADHDAVERALADPAASPASAPAPAPTPPPARKTRRPRRITT